MKNVKMKDGLLKLNMQYAIGNPQVISQQGEITKWKYSIKWNECNDNYEGFIELY